MENEDVPQDILDLAHHTAAKFEAIACFTDISQDADQSIMVRVCWDGLPDECDWTWHKIEDMFDDVPDMLAEYLSKIKDGPKKQVAISAQSLLNIS